MGVLVDERVINKVFADKINSLPVKIVVSHQHLIFSKENAEKKKGIFHPYLSSPLLKEEEI